MRQLIGENLHGCDLNNMRVLSYQHKTQAFPENCPNPLNIVCSPINVKPLRNIPKEPVRILTVPGIINDYCKPEFIHNFY